MDGLEALPRVLAASPAHTCGDVQRLRGAGPRRAGARRSGRPRSSRSRRRSTTSLDRLLAVAGRRRLTGPDRAPPPARRTRSTAGPRRAPRAVPRGLRRGRDRDGDDDADGPAGAGQPRARGAGAASASRTSSALSYGDLDRQPGGRGHRRARRHPSGARSTSCSSSTGSPRPATQRRLRATLAPVRDSGGRALYVFLQVQDVTAERAAAEELRRSEERFRLLVEAVRGLRDLHARPDRARRQLEQRSAAQQGLHRRARSSASTSGSSTRPRSRRAGTPSTSSRLALRDGHYEEEGWRLRKDGSRFWANVLITAVYDAGGRHIGFAKVTRDTTERRRLEQERERAVEALGAANTELESLNTRLQQAAEDQSQFLAVTAHELRPRSACSAGSADMLSQHWSELTDEERATCSTAMTTSTTRLRRLLADLLTASRLQASALEMRPEWSRSATSSRDAVTTVRRTHPEARDRRRRAARHHRARRPGQARAGPGQPARQRAASRCAARPVRPPPGPARVRIRVSDEGPGVPPPCSRACSTGSPPGSAAAAPGWACSSCASWPARRAATPSTRVASPEDVKGTFVIVLPDGSLPRPSSSP